MKLPGNMQAMMKQAEQMQRKMQEEVALIRVEASAGDVEMLQDMVMAAFNEAAKKVDEEIQHKMGGMLGGMGLPPGLL
jgi:DNA-binding protein YbaB